MIESSTSLVVDDPYLVGQARVRMLSLAGLTALGSFAAGYYALMSPAATTRTIGLVVCPVFAWFAWAATRVAARVAAQTYPSSWSFDEAGWSCSDPLRELTFKVEWQQVVEVRLVQGEGTPDIYLYTSDAERGTTSQSLAALRPQAVQQLVDQLAAHVPLERIQPAVLTLGSNPSLAAALHTRTHADLAP